jgi:fucose permease
MPTATARARLLLGLAGLGFVSLGLPDGLLGVAWPSLRAGFGLAQDALGALLVATTTGYVLSSFASGPLLARLGLGALLALSCLATAASLIGYALAGAWPLLVALGVLAGLGAGAIDAGINGYVATNHSPRALNLLHAGYGLGTTAGPALMTGLLMAGAPWQRGYAIVGAGQIALGLAFLATRRLWPDRAATPAARAESAPLAHTLRRPPAWTNALAFALYTGLEAAAGAWSYTLLHEERGVAMAGAGSAVSLYWGALMAGRVAFALSLAAAPAGRLLGACLAGVALAALGLALDLGPAASLASLAALGFCAGPIFPSLIAATPARFGAAHAPNAVGLSVAAAAVGQALLPAALGVGAVSLGLELVPRALLAVALLLLVVSRALAAQQDPEADRDEARAGDPA